jgi:siroheme synthase-like protein
MMLDMQPSAGPALVVGGGEVAARKVKALAEGEFVVTVIAPSVCDAIRSAPHTTVLEREFQSADVDAGWGYALVFACTDNRAVNKEIGRLARLANIPVVVADAQAESTFFTPAVLRDGDLMVGVSTGGASPTAARMIREKILAAIGPGWGGILATARHEREARLARKRDGDV